MELIGGPARPGQAALAAGATGRSQSMRVYASIAPLFAGWSRELEELYDGYSDEQLETILHFLTEAARRQQEATARLVQPPDAAGG